MAQALQVNGITWPDSGATADADIRPSARYALQDALHQRSVLRRAGHVPEEGGELVAAQAHDMVARAHGFLHRICHSAQCSITMGVTEVVVELLEVVGTEQQQCVLAMLRGSRSDRVLRGCSCRWLPAPVKGSSMLMRSCSACRRRLTHRPPPASTSRIEVKTCRAVRRQRMGARSAGSATLNATRYCLPPLTMVCAGRARLR